jgi:hypothetical protein
MPNQILYQAITPGTINECRYSLLKYLSVYNLNPPPNIAISVRTNTPAAFESFIPFFEKFELTGYDETKPGKIDLIKDCLSCKTCNLLYLNTDSYPSGPVDGIFQELLKKDFLFLKRNPGLDKSRLQAFQKIKFYLTNNEVSVDDKRIVYPSTEDFYSAEVIGVNHYSFPVFQKIFQLYLQLVTEVPAAEAAEFAFAYYAGASSGIVENTISSYRNFPAFKKLLQAFFVKNEEESIPNLVKMVYHLDAEAIQQEKNRYDSQPFVKRILSTLSGKAWSVRQYQNKF